MSQTSLNILVTATTAQAKAQLAAVSAQMKGMAAQAGVSSGAMSKMGKGSVAGAAGVAAVGAASVIATKKLYSLGKQFDEAYDTIRVGTGATGKELDKLKANFKEVAKTVPNDLAEVGDAVANLSTRLDLSGKPLEEMAESMLNLSNITKTDLKTNIESVAIAFKAWDIPAKKQLGMLNGLYRVGQKSGATVADLAKNMQQFSSPLRAAGFALDDAAAMFASFQKAGVNVSTMMPGFKLAMGNLTAPTVQLTESLKELNINTDADPMKNFQKVMGMLSNSNKELTKRQKEQLAVSVFGKRATIDFMDAIRQGRFEYEDYLDVLKNGDDTIKKASEDVYDFSENMSEFGNKVKVAIEPAASAVFDFASRVSKWLAGPQGTKAIKVTGQVFTGTFKAISQALRPFVTLFRTSFIAIRDIVRAVSKFFREDVTKAWDAVRTTFKSGTDAIKSNVQGLISPFKSAFQTIVDVVRDKFSSAFDAAAGFIGKIIGVINLIPGVKIKGPNHFGSQGSWDNSNAVPQGRQRGGMMYGGKPTGDSIPTMLERGEYVLNRKAVDKVGVGRLNQLNFKQAARFQTGGPIGMNIGGVADAVKGAAGKVASGAGSLLGKGAGFFINKLPKPNLPEPIAGVGPYAIDKVKDWIKNKVKSLFDKHGGKGGNVNLGAASGEIANIMALAQQMGLQITSGFPLGTPGVHSPNSYHYQSGRAFDASNGVNTPEMAAFAQKTAGRWGGRLAELFYDPLGWFIKHGSKIGGQIGGHSDHVHVAMQRGGEVGTRSGSGFEPWKVARVAYRAGFRGSDLRTAVAVAGAESTFNPSAHNTAGEDSRGLWQINVGPGANTQYASKNLFHPGVNARVAHEMWKSQGWGPWTQYNTGAYKPFLGKADHAIGTFMRLKGKGGGKGGKPAKPELTGKQKKNRRRISRTAGRAFNYAKEVQGEAPNKKLAQRAVNAATKAKNLAKSGEFGKAHKWTKKAQGLTKKAAGTIPGLKPKRPPFATPGGRFDPSKDFNPKNLPGFKSLPAPIQKLLMSPGLSWQGRRSLADMALNMAGDTATKKDDAAALNVILGLEKGRKKSAQKTLRKANTVLARGGLTKKQRQRWMGIRDNALNTIAGSTGEIISTRGQIKDLNQADDSEATMAEAMKELAEAIKEQNRLQSGVQAVSSREALRMLSDVISGEIVGKRAAPGPSYAGVRY